MKKFKKILKKKSIKMGKSEEIQEKFKKKSLKKS